MITLSGIPAVQTIECWACGRDEPHVARKLCKRCYGRWSKRGFSGAGPGPERMWALDQAREHEHVVLGLSATQAARKLGVSARTVQRWRAALRAAA